MQDHKARVETIAEEFLADGWLGTRAGEAIHDLLEDRARLESSLTQARELMRVAADGMYLRIHNSVGIVEQCTKCDQASVSAVKIIHAPDCLVTKLREAAKQEDRTDAR